MKPSRHEILNRGLLLLAFLGLSVAGCNRASHPELVTAVFQDERTPDGNAEQEETVLVTLSQELPPELDTESFVVSLAPCEESWEGRVERTDDPRVLRVRILTGTPSLRLEGLYGRDDGSTGLSLDFGRGPTWIDLQARASLPLLERVVWDDRSHAGGNLLVDRGDWLRLVFDAPVRLSGDSLVDPARDVVLRYGDSLGSEASPATFEEGEFDNEIRIVLGDAPNLVPGSSDDPNASTLSVRGTPVLPLAKIRDRRGGLGAISRGPLTVEIGPHVRRPRGRPQEEFPDGVERVEHTVSRFQIRKALVIGGRDPETDREISDNVLIYDPFASRVGAEPFTQGPSLPTPLRNHTATTLDGPDGALGTLDDVVVVTGGKSGAQDIGDVTMIAPNGQGNVRVVPLAPLFVPRAKHRTVRSGVNRLVVDGGTCERGIVGATEILTFEFDHAGTPKLEAHKLYRTQPRSGHSLTALPPAKNGEHFILIYGGYGLGNLNLKPAAYGQDMEGQPQADLFSRLNTGKVLVSPLLFNTDRPSASIHFLDYLDRQAYELAYLRREHEAELIERLDDDTHASTVVICGGINEHPFDDLKISSHLEMPIVPGMLDFHDAVRQAVLFHFDEEAPSQSSLETLPVAPTVPARRYADAVSVPGYGVLVTGGVLPGPRAPLSGVDVVTVGGSRVQPLGVSLTTPRSEHRGYFVDDEDLRAVIIIGGRFPEDADGVAAVEEIRLPEM